MEIWAVLNLTADSFYSQSRVSQNEFIDRAASALEAGADVLDIGAESSRPFSEEISVEEEWRRLEKPLLDLKQTMGASEFHQKVSIDTRKSETVRRVLELGVGCINDISAGVNDDILHEVAKADVRYVLMHSKGTPGTMQVNPQYDNVVAEIFQFFQDGISRVLAAGILREKLILDPGFGFGKTTDHNLSLLRHVGEFRKLGLPLLYGVSRKSFFKDIPGIPEPDNRGMATQIVHAWLTLQRVDILRVHDVLDTVHMKTIIESLVGKEYELA